MNLSENKNQRLFKVYGVKCAVCIDKLTKALQEKDSIARVTVDISTQELSLNSQLSDTQIREILSNLNYLSKDDNQEKQTPLPQLDKSSQSKVLNNQALENEPRHRFLINGMTCIACAKSVEKTLNKISGVSLAEVNFANRIAQVSGEVNPDILINAVFDIGYEAIFIKDLHKAEVERNKKEQQAYRLKKIQSWVGISVGLLLMLYGLFGGGMMVAPGTSQMQWGIVGIICLGVMWFCGRHFYRGAWLMLKRFESNMDTLVALGTLSAWLYSMVVVFSPTWFDETSRHVYFEAAVMILGMINLGQALELKTRGKTSQEIRRLLDLQVKTAQVIRGGKEITLPIEQVKVGDGIHVRAGKKIPVDGVLTEGQSRINEAMLTGESFAVKKQAGDKVFLGTLNNEGSFILRATQVGDDTKLAQIVQMVSQAQNSKPPIGNLANRVVAIFVPVVLLVAVITAFFWWLAGAETSHILVTSISVLIIACPCALGLATPISTMIGIGKAAEYGGLIRHGAALQTAAEIDTVVLDKTGTITQGKPSVVDSLIAEKNDKDEMYQIISAMEQGSTHPLAKAILEFTHSEKSTTSAVAVLEDLNSVDGRGLTANVSGKELYLGNEALMLDAGVELKAYDFFKAVNEWKEAAYTVVFFAVDNQLQAVFAISDALREEAKTAIKQLINRGIHLVMLTGDNTQTAAAIAKQTGITDWQAECLPKDKLKRVKLLQSQGHRVAVVGDGINDAPALAIADVGFAIGEGADAAIENSDITLLNPSLNGVANVIGISEATLTNIKQNLWGAFLYNTLGIPLAAGILFLWTGWLLSPIIAGLAMALSSVTVVSNANRLRSWKLKK